MYEPHETVRLVGGFNCYLTARERNLWHDHLHGSELWSRLVEVNATEAKLQSQAAAGIDVGDAFLELVRTRASLDAELYQFAKAWHADVIEAKEAAETA